jgi:hypothetical protein
LLAESSTGSASPQALGKGEPAKKKNQISKASNAATTLITKTHSTPLIRSRRHLSG